MTGTQNGEESGAVVGPARVGAAFALASLLLALADSLMIIGAGSSESIPGELWWFAPRLLIAAPLVIGALAVLACHLGRRLARVHRLGALLMDVFLTVPWFVCTYALFSGPSIAASPFRIPGVAVVSLACLAAVRVLRVAPLRMRNWLRTHRPLAPDAIHGVGFLGAAGFSALVAWVTLHTFRGLYPAFHVALTLTAIVGAGTMLTATSNETFGRTWRRLGPLWPGGAGFVLWFALVPFCFPAAAGREVLSARTPFASSMVGAMFRTDLAITNLIERDASEGERRPVLAPLDGLHFLPGAPKRDILLVTVDALRGDVLDPGSRFGPCATGLQRVATRASAFPHAYAPSNATIRSLPGLLTGQVGASARTPGRQFLPRVLSEHGYSTSAWVSSHDRPTDLDDLIRLRRVGFGFATYRAEYQPSKHILEWAERELDRTHPNFVWVHLSDVHAPYSLPLQSNVNHCASDDPYGVRVSDLDASLGPALERIAKRPNLVWALTADHGESRGERGVYGHASRLHEEQIRVPLFLGGDGIAPSITTRPVTTLDLPATLALLAGAKPAPGTPTLLLSGGAPATKTRGALVTTEHACAAVTGAGKIIANTGTGSVSVYDLRKDPEESQNLAAGNASGTNALLRTLTDLGCPQPLAGLERR